MDAAGQNHRQHADTRFDMFKHHPGPEQTRRFVPDLLRQQPISTVHTVTTNLRHCIHKCRLLEVPKSREEGLQISARMYNTPLIYCSQTCRRSTEPAYNTTISFTPGMPASHLLQQLTGIPASWSCSRKAHVLECRFTHAAVMFWKQATPGRPHTVHAAMTPRMHHISHLNTDSRM